MRKKIFSKKSMVTHEDVEKAMTAFFAEGGSISLIKPQSYVPKSVIGGSTEDLYEGISDMNVSELETSPLAEC